MTPKSPWSKEKALEWFKLNKIVAVLTPMLAEDGRAAMEALIKGGIKLFEINMNAPAAQEILRIYSGNGAILAGGGSIMSEKMSKNALAAGAHYAASPLCQEALVKEWKRAGIFFCAGGFTPSEIVAAWTAGSSIVEVAPAHGAGGPRYIEAIKQVLPDVPLAAGGDASLDNMRDYFIAGATAVRIAVPQPKVGADGKRRWADLTGLAKQWLDVLQHI